MILHVISSISKENVNSSLDKGYEYKNTIEIRKYGTIHAGDYGEIFIHGAGSEIVS